MQNPLYIIIKFDENFQILLTAILYKEKLMNRKQLVEAICSNKEIGDLSKKSIDNILTTTLDIIKKTVKKGDDVSLLGFGTFSKARRKARTGVNPATGEKIKIKAKNVVKFSAGKAWKEML